MKLMKKITFLAAALFALFLFVQNSPATVITVDQQEITWNDDTTKVVKTAGEVNKETDSKKVYCDPAKCEKVCGKKAVKTTKSCCPKGDATKKDPEKK